MTQNEKFNARNVAFRWAKELYPTLTREQQMEIEADFPELKNGGDDKIRRKLLRYCCDKAELYIATIAWLNKKKESNLIEEINRRKELLSNEEMKVISLKEKLILSKKIAVLEELLVFAEKG